MIKFNRLEIISLLKLDLVTDLVTSHLALTTPNTPTKPTNPHSPTPTAPTGGYQHPLIISCCSGDTLEGDLKKRLALGKEKAATGTALFL